MEPLTKIEEILLLTILELGDLAYGVSIRQKIEATTGRNFSVGAIYVPLDRLVEKGLLETEQGEPTPERGGRSKRYYRLTPQGHNALREAKQLYDALWRNFAGRTGQ